MAPQNLFSILAPPYLLLSLLLACIPLLSLLKQAKARRNKLPPGPRRLPIIGNLHQLGGLPHHSLQNLSIQYGPLMFLQLGSIPALVISSGEVAREAFTAHDTVLSGRPAALYAAKKLSYNFSGISFTPYGEYWRQARKICVLELLSAKRVQSFRRVREEEVASLIASVERLSSSSSSSSSSGSSLGDPVNLSAMTLTLTGSIFRRIAFGESHGTGEYNVDGEEQKFHGILAKTQSLLGGFCVSDFFPCLEWIHAFTGLRSRLQRNFEHLDAFFDQVIEEHLTAAWPEPEHEDLVHVLLRLHEDPTHGSTFSSRNHIKGILTDMFIAGTDTTSATIVWTMAELMRNPRAMSKAQEELRNVVGDKGKVEEIDLKNLVYLNLVVKEALRLRPPAPLLVPRETTDMCIINGYEIPAKTRVFINAKAIAMNPQSWAKPREFWPERFLGNDVDFRGQDFSLIPFGVGRRSCPGISSGLAVVELALANLLYYFNWRLPNGMEDRDLDMEAAIGLTMHKKNPLYLLAKPNYHKII